MYTKRMLVIVLILCPLLFIFSPPSITISGDKQQCHLKDPISTPPSPHPNCSCPSAWRHGTGQHVVAFSFYGDPTSPHMVAKEYWLGLIRNLEAIPKTFGPKWRVRLYHDLRDEDPLMGELCHISKAHPILDLCPVSSVSLLPNVPSIFPMLWRVLPTLDSQVSVLLPRDLDSVASTRESAALTDWIQNSNFSFHVMRDHPDHGVPMLGGMWGWRRATRTRPDWDSVWKRLLRDPLAKAPRSEWGHDQTLLRRYIWRWARKDCLSHDAFHCSKFSKTKPFPTKRILQPNNFVGAVTSDNYVLESECPEKCRPAAQKDWTFC